MLGRSADAKKAIFFVLSELRIELDKNQTCKWRVVILQMLQVGSGPQEAYKNSQFQKKKSSTLSIAGVQVCRLSKQEDR